MKKVTDEEVQRAVDRWYDTSASIGEILEEFIANREKDEASEPTITVVADTVIVDGKTYFGESYLELAYNNTKRAKTRISELEDECKTSSLQAKMAIARQLELESYTLSEPKVCEYCGPKRYGAPKATPQPSPYEYVPSAASNMTRVTESYIPEPTITVSEHKAKMREAIEYTARAFSPSDVLALPEWGSAVRNICAHYGLTEPTKTPEERVTTGSTGEEWRVFLDGEIAMCFDKRYYSQEVAEYARVGLIAKLKEDAK